MRKKLFIYFLCFFATACSIKNAKITETNKEQLMEDAAWSMGIAGEELTLLSSAFQDSYLTGGKLEGKTIGEVLADQKRIIAEEEKSKHAKEDAEEMRLREIHKKAELEKYIKITPVKKTFLPTGIYDGVFDSVFRIELVVHNNSDKDIKTFSGIMTFRDRANNILLRRVETNYSIVGKDIKAGEKRQWISIQTYNENNPDDKAFKNAALENLVFEWQAMRIVLSDGKILGAL
jgi:hypothetical protein